jgi:dynein heavy chain
MDAVLGNVASSLFNGQLPSTWRKLAPDTCMRLGAWMDHFEKRSEQYTLWVKFCNIIVINNMLVLFRKILC